MPLLPQDVLWRVTSSFFGPFKPDFMATTMSNPDLYGPFWIATTLVFVTAVAGNYADFVAWRLAEKGAAASSAGGDPGNSTTSATTDMLWYTDYAKLSYSALLFYGEQVADVCELQRRARHTQGTSRWAE